MALPLRDDTPTKRTPWATYGIILANVVIFLFLQPSAFQRPPSSSDTDPYSRRAAAVRYEYRWAAIPCEISQTRSLADGARCSGQRDPDAPSPLPDKSIWFSMLASMFLHANLGHIAGNMLFLWVFGRHVEDRIGPLPFVLLYLVTGVIALLGHVAFHADDAVPLLGASGAIAGIMGAALVFRPRGRILAVVATAAFQVVYVPAFVLLGLFFVTQFFTPDSSHVAWVAHAAGMAAGALFALPLALLFKDPQAAPEPESAPVPVG